MLTITLLNFTIYCVLCSLMEIFLERNQQISTDNFWIIWPIDLKTAGFQVPFWYYHKLILLFVDMNHTFFFVCFSLEGARGKGLLSYSKEMF